MVKSISFTHFKEKLLDGTKRRTFRCIFVPNYEVGEIVNIVWKENKKREVLFQARVTSIYPLKIKQVTLGEAIDDGFDTREDFIEEILKINRIKSSNRWGFFIRFRKIDTKK